MKRSASRPWYLPIFVLFLGVLSTIMLIGVNHISQRQLATSILLNVVMDVQVRTATAHLWLEEALTGDTDITPEQIASYFSLAENGIKAIRTGGKTEHGLIVNRPDDPGVQQRAVELSTLFEVFRRMAVERYNDPSVAGIGSELDQRFDSLFEAFQQEAFSLQRMIGTDQIRIRRDSRILFFSIVFAWIVLLAASIGGLWVREGRRLAANKALEATNDELQLKTNELNRHRDHLQDLVKERTSQLERANASLRRTNRHLEELNMELQDFTFIASHDLQEPLRKVQAFGSMLAEKCGVSLDEASRDYISRMQSATARMKELLASLLAYSRVTTRAEPMKETDLRKSVEEALSNLEITIREKNARVEIGELPTVRADEIQMVQLFQNLIGNALKFQSDGKTPCVKIYSQKAGDKSGTYAICVEDNGIGFEEKYLDKIFLPLQRLHGRSNGYEGMGMGLAICRKIMGRLGGGVTARSELGKGSTFIVTLPAPGETHEG